MSTATLVEIRQAIATAIASTLPNARQSVYAPANIGEDGAGAQGSFFSVEAGTTNLEEVRHIRAEGIKAQSDIIVRYVRRIRSPGQMADYDLILGTENNILYAVQQVTDYASIKAKPFICSSISREIVGEGAWMSITLRGIVEHWYLPVAPS